MPEQSVRPEVLELAPYIAGKPIPEVQREFGLTDIVKLASNENPLGPSPLALAALRTAAAEAHIYPEPTAPALRQALARRLGLCADWLFVGNGSDEILRLLAASYIRARDRVLVPDCSFPNYRTVATLFGAVVEVIPLAGETMDLEAMAHAATASAKGSAAPGSDALESTSGQGPAVARGVSPRIIFLCRPNNPTGAVFAEAAFRRFMAQVEPETLVVVDQAYHEFDASPFDSLALLRRFPNLILTRTFSKAHGLAALRIGYGIARPEIWAPLLRVREPFSVNGLAQAAALAALEDEAHLAKTLATARAGKAYLASLCRELGIAYVPSEANFLFIDLGRPAQPVYEALLREGVIVRPCGAFGRPTCVRVTAGSEEAMQRFGEALRRALGR